MFFKNDYDVASRCNLQREFFKKRIYEIVESAELAANIKFHFAERMAEATEVIIKTISFHIVLVVHFRRVD